ncbi:unnamed protein product [Lathyrus oleraceus]
MSLGYDKKKSLDQFVENIQGSLGDGRRMPFWYCKWMENQTLNEVFPNLFSVFPNQKGNVVDLGFWRGSIWIWLIHVPFLPSGSTLSRELEELELLLAEREPDVCCSDNFVWSHEDSFVFTISSCYEILFQNRQPFVIVDEAALALKMMWRSKIPSKIQLFCGGFFWDKSATKDQLVKRGINFVGNDMSCVMCNCFAESSFHLFLEFVCAEKVWMGVERWLGLDLRRPSDCVSSFVSFDRSLRKEVENEFGNIIWSFTVWIQCKGGNSLIFKSSTFNVDDLLNSIKFLS